MNRSLLYTLFFICAIFTASLAGFGQSPFTTEIAGGEGGRPFTESDIPRDARILEIRIFSGDLVDAVQAVYMLADGRVVESSRYGGSKGQRHTFRLDSDERITGISGRYGELIDSIRIHTNKRTSPVYGGDGGARPYRINVPSGNRAVGFSGRSGDYLDAIGLVFMPIWIQPSGATQAAGSRGGTPFADSEIPLGAKISAVHIWSGNVIDRIQLIYSLRDGSIFEGAIHGGSGGNRQVFRLTDNEYIIGISGRYGEVLDSLRIHTNRRTSSLFGGRGGDRNFNIEIPTGNQAIGLKGRSGKYLDAVGLEYIRLQESNRRSPTQRPNRRGSGRGKRQY